MEVLLDLAVKASPPFALGCILALGILWKQHVKDMAAIKTLTDAQLAAAVSTAKAITEISATVALFSKMIKRRG